MKKETYILKKGDYTKPLRSKNREEAEKIAKNEEAELYILHPKSFREIDWKKYDVFFDTNLKSFLIYQKNNEKTSS